MSWPARGSEVAVYVVGCLIVAAVLGMCAWFVRTTKRLNTQDTALIEILRVIRPPGGPSLEVTLALILAHQQQGQTP